MLSTVGESKNKLISDVLLWTPANGHISDGWSAPFGYWMLSRGLVNSDDL